MIMNKDTTETPGVLPGEGEISGGGKGLMGKSSGKKKSTRITCLQLAATRVAGGLETLFFKLGLAIARRPYTVILCCFLMSALCGLGMIRFEIKDLAEPIWIPKDSPVVTNKDLAAGSFPDRFRYNTIILEADNILTPDALTSMLEIDEAVKDIRNSSKTNPAMNYNWTSLCRQQGGRCVSYSLLALWGYNGTLIRSLTKEAILDTVNAVRGTASSFLKEVQEDSDGRVVGAHFSKILYVIKATKALPLENKIEAPELYWEQSFIDYVLTNTSKPGLKDVYVNAVRSYRDQSDQSFESDVFLLIAGVGIIITYVAIVLGKFNEVEHKVYLALIGVFGIGLASLVAYGLASAVGLFYGPIHPILPFLLLGLGVDDMFVIVESWNNLTPLQKKKDIPHKIAIALKHSGVSITVTSFTDFVAFAIGASTKLPALQSFCGYAALGILSLFIMQSTFFVAWMAVDVRRQENHQDACCRFIKYENFVPNKCSQKQFLSWFLRRVYSRCLIYLPTKVFIFVISLGLIMIGAYGVYNLETNTELVRYLPANSYLTRYIAIQKEYFPEDGQRGNVYLIGPIDYYRKRQEMADLHERMYQSPYIITKKRPIDSWHTAFNDFLNRSALSQVPPKDDYYPPTEGSYYQALYQFYWQSFQRGAPYSDDLKWNDTTDPLNFTKPRRVIASKIPFVMPTILDTSSKIDALNELENLSDHTEPLSSFAVSTSTSTVTTALSPGSAGDVTAEESHGLVAVFPWAVAFENWETTRVIKGELYTNMGLAFLAVLVVTLCLVADLWMCLLVSVNVVITLVEVCGFMKFWSIDIDTLTSILLILSIGLAVDFSAHVGHTFMTVAGSKDERARQTIRLIGPAIINGGFSTLLAFMLLANSDSYIFFTFFKVFFLVVVFGLFNGLALLPIVLSWVGPSPYLNARVPTSTGMLKSPDRLVHHQLRHHDDEDVLSTNFDEIEADLVSLPESRRSFHLRTEAIATASDSAVATVSDSAVAMVTRSLSPSDQQCARLVPNEQAHDSNVAADGHLRCELTKPHIKAGVTTSAVVTEGGAVPRPVPNGNTSSVNPKMSTKSSQVSVHSPPHTCACALRQQLKTAKASEAQKQQNH